VKRRFTQLARRILPSWLWSRLKRIHVFLSPQLRHAKFTFRLAANVAYDFRRYRRFSADRLSLSDENLRALIAMDAHRIEKGLTLRAPRVGFGMWFLPRLLKNIRDHEAAHGSDHWTSMARHALKAHFDFNEQHGYRPRSNVRPCPSWRPWRGARRTAPTEELSQSAAATCGRMPAVTSDRSSGPATASGSSERPRYPGR
jgi:hypothetical protein